MLIPCAAVSAAHSLSRDSATHSLNRDSATHSLSEIVLRTISEKFLLKPFHDLLFQSGYV